MSGPKPRVLCVDDEPRVLDGVRRHLRRHFDVDSAPDGTAGLQAVAGETFAAVVSDLRMPGMDGVDFLSKVRERSPDTTRILLTGGADLQAAVAAVNDGEIFRFLTKPCPPDKLTRAVQMGVEQHRLVTAERELLERTLHGSVKMLVEVLALASPEAFGHASRVKQRAGALAAELGAPERWRMEMAAMLSAVAYVAVPRDTLERVQSGETLSSAEQSMIDRLPLVAENLLADIPRLEEVREIVRGQAEPAELAPVGSQILRAVLDLDLLESKGCEAEEALEVMNGREGVYAPRVLTALGALPGNGAADETRSVSIQGLAEGMVLLESVESSDGRMLVARGQEVSVGILERLRNFSSNMEVKEPVKVLIRSTVPEPVAVGG